MAERSPVELVIAAIMTLPEEDRNEALAWLIDRGTHSSMPEHIPPLEPTLVQGALRRHASLHGEHQGILVRLPVEAHGQLREWCEQHNFAMATVIRGLVDRFLDQQARPGRAVAG
ncbi:MAG: hypothetical protein WCA46_26205 [Actinocatenispora sp.]